MEKSYQEILNILTLMGKDELKKRVYKGSTDYLPDEETAVESPAAADLAARAMNYTPEKPLYVLAIGANYKCGFCNFEKSGYYRPDRDRMAGRQCTALAGKQRI